MTPQFLSLRKQHPSLTFVDFQTTWHGQDLLCTFHYQLENGPLFTHQVTFCQANPTQWESQSPTLSKQLIFNLGLVEMFSYWKVTCSPLINIKAGSLSHSQLTFWQKLLLRGMSEYFYVNQIPPREDLVTWHISNSPSPSALPAKLNSHQQLVGLSGGKDSLVTASLLQTNNVSFDFLTIEPTSPATAICAKNFPVQTRRIQRAIDPQLLTLNHQGYLNGHVPFSASVAFLGVTAAVLYDYQSFIVSNEQSANENSFMWQSQPINHQYSKSFEFEKDFVNYCKKFIVNNVGYFSFIRPFYEIKIAQIFSTLPKNLHLSFRSCNCGQKENRWCENCSKCFFVYLLLSPFLDQKYLSTQIFHTNLLANDNFIETTKDLVGLNPHKPLECIGTLEESKVAFYLTIQKYTTENISLTPLLQLIKSQLIDQETNWEDRAQKLLHHFDNQHHLPDWTSNLLYNT